MLANTLADSLTSHRFSDKRRLQGVVAAGAGGRPGGEGSAAWDPASRRCRQGGFAEGAEYGRWVVKAVVKAARRGIRGLWRHPESSPSADGFSELLASSSFRASQAGERSGACTSTLRHLSEIISNHQARASPGKKAGTLGWLDSCVQRGNRSAAPLPTPSSTGGRERPQRIRPSTGNRAVKVGAALSLGKSA